MVSMPSELEELDVRLPWLRARSGLKWRAVRPAGIAAWIADMDFAAPPVVRDALARLATEGDLGYPEWLHEAVPLREAFAARMAQRYGWSPDPAEVHDFSDIIQGLQAVLHVATAPGDAVAMHLPAYPPFLETLAAMDRRLVPVPVERSASGWVFDPERLARDVATAGVRALVLVNPHNPTGRSFTRPELDAIAAVAAAHDVLVIADEVHADLTYPGFGHTPFASISAEAAGRTVTLTSATKAFNLAGIRCAVAHIGSAAVRGALAALPPLIFGAANVPGVTATLAAWQDADEWLAAVLSGLDENRRYLEKALTPLGVGYLPPDATYLAWLDCRDLGLPEDPAAFFWDRAQIKLSPGPDFAPAGHTPAIPAGLDPGTGGTGFARLNFATSGSVLAEICDRMAAALKHLC